MKFNKKIALILALTLILAASIPALAATTMISGQYQAPVLDVVIPTSGQIVVNPLKLPVTVTAEDNKTALGKLTNPGQIATKPLIGYNLGETELQIGATVVGEENGDFEFVTTATAPAANEKAKKGLVYLQLSNPKTDSNPYTLTVDTTAAKSTTVCKGVNGAAALNALNAWPARAFNATNDVQVTTDEKTNENMCTVKGTTGTAPDDEGYFMARLCGDIVKKPEEDWTSSDGLKTTVTWIIQPVEPAP